jgi:hypothetical protein
MSGKIILKIYLGFCGSNASRVYMRFSAIERLI